MYQTQTPPFSHSRKARELGSRHRHTKTNFGRNFSLLLPICISLHVSHATRWLRNVIPSYTNDSEVKQGHISCIGLCNVNSDGLTYSFCT